MNALPLASRPGYGWVMAGVTFTLTALSFGILGSAGVFLKPLAADFGWSRGNEPQLTIAPGASVEFQITDTGGGEITPESTAENVDAMNFDNFMPLTGPVAVDGAKAGDALKITFLGFRPSGWGWSMISDRYGILPDQFPGTFLKIWNYDPSGEKPIDYEGKARFPMRPFPGIIGMARDCEETLSSIPPHTSGGNLDVRDLSEGTELYLPVELEGGLLSLGDTHVAQGHGELAGTALESPVDVLIKVDLIKDAGITAPQFTTRSHPNAHVDKDGYFVTCGISEDLSEAARQATSHMIDLLGRLHSLAAIDAYLLCSLCGDLVINEMVNKPVNVVSLYFPKYVLG